MKFLSEIMNFILFMCTKFSIDESHGILHSMKVLEYATKIYDSELLLNNKKIKEHENIIFISALLHDVCDKKYLDENEGISHIKQFLHNKIGDTEITIILKIIETLSYSKVKKYGFPDLGEYQLAYNIVREADLLTAYDFDRCLIYKMKKYNYDFNDAFTDANLLFEKRVFKHFDDKLFVTDYSKVEAINLQNIAMTRIKYWNKVLNSKTFKNI